MKRMKLKRSKKYKKLNLFTILLIFLIISIIYLLNIFNERALPIFVNYSNIEVERIATLIINTALIDEIATHTTINDLFIIKEDSNGNIISMDIDSSKANKLLFYTNSVLEKNLNYLQTGQIDKLNIGNIGIENNDKGVIYKLPSGIIFNNIFLNNLLPKIPVKLNLVGTVFSKFSTDVESFGINNAIIKVNIDVSTELKVILPFTSSNIKLSTSVPIIIKVIEGEVPSYYFDEIVQ